VAVERTRGTDTASGILRLSRKHHRMSRVERGIVVMGTCLMLAVDEFVDGLMHNLRR
jgi:hypothetical protein